MNASTRFNETPRCSDAAGSIGTVSPLPERATCGPDTPVSGPSFSGESKSNNEPSVSVADRLPKVENSNRGRFKCPSCGGMNTAAMDSRLNDDNEIRRRRGCRSCDYRWTTYERVAASGKDRMPGSGPFKLKLTPAEWRRVIEGKTL
jgi:DNA-directed RNA polymerase subunit M/transcription elongation factor TFIIS